jgi:hypothetical protein
VLEEARNHVALRGLLHRPAQAPVAEHGVAVEVDLLDPHPVALVDRVGHPLLAGRHLLELVLDLGEAIALLAVHVLERHLEPRHFAEVDRLALVQADPVLDDAIGDVGVADPLQAFVDDRAQHGAFLDLDRELDATLVGRGLDLDVVHQVARPEVVQVRVQAPVLQRLADLEAEVEEQALLRQRAQPLHLDRGDRRPSFLRHRVALRARRVRRQTAMHNTANNSGGTSRAACLIPLPGRGAPRGRRFSVP